MQRKVIIGVLIAIFGLISCLMLVSIAPSEAIGQLVFLIFGMITYVLAQILQPKFYLKILPVTAFLIFLGLIVTFFLGKLSHGAVRWLPIGPIHLQVSEFAKPLLVLLLAKFAHDYPLTNTRRIFIFLTLGLLFLVPVFLQPDLGSALVIAVIIFSMLFLRVTKLKLLLPWVAISFILLVIMWNTVLYSYQRDRLTSFLTGQGTATYNATQSYITVGSGKLLGRGLGHGVQSQLRFLPEFHTDFFFASLAEELGFVGVTGILCLYILFFAVLLVKPRLASRNSHDAISCFVAALFFQMAVNIAMNIRLFPITGIPLPLLSSGGSSFLSICLGIGAMVRLSDEQDLIPSGILMKRI